MSDWTNDGWPDWIDVGKRVEIELEDGSTVTGTLWADEMFDGENEYPLFYLETDKDPELSFGSAVKWRFLD